MPDLDHTNFIRFRKAYSQSPLFTSPLFPPPTLCSLLSLMVEIVRNAYVKVVSRFVLHYLEKSVASFWFRVSYEQFSLIKHLAQFLVLECMLYPGKSNNKLSR